MKTCQKSVGPVQTAQRLPVMVQVNFIKRNHAGGGIKARAGGNLSQQLQFLKARSLRLKVAEPGFIATAA
jgi:hypothetical protein